MLTVSKYNEIYLTRGDTARLTVKVSIDGWRTYEVQSDDVFTLTVKKKCEDKEALIEKKVTGNTNFHIKPEDTKGLSFGEYRYDVQLTTASGDNYTIIDDNVFEIAKEVG